MGLGPQRKDSKTFGTTVYGLTHPSTEYYFGDTTGTISSYNFNSGNGYNLANQNHKICIRSEGTNCKICYTTAVPDFQISGSKTSPASGTYSFLTTSCCQYTANGIINYLLLIII